MPATAACAESGRRPAHFSLGLQSGEAKARRRPPREFRRHRFLTFLLQAHDPPKHALWLPPWVSPVGRQHLALIPRLTPPSHTQPAAPFPITLPHSPLA